MPFVKCKPDSGHLKSLSLAVCSLFVVIAYSCTSDVPTLGPASEAENDIAIDTPAPTTIGDVVAADTRRRGGTVRISASNALIPDPAAGEQGLTLSKSYDLQREIYSGLVKVVDDPSAPFVGDLADHWEVSDDLKTYTFSLRPGLRFSDGSPVSASDFKWSWERALAIGSDRALDAFSGIAGADAMLTGAESDLDGIAFVDEQTLRVELSAPDPYFLAKAASPPSFVLKHENVEQWGIDWSNWFRDTNADSYSATGSALPVGTGPFTLTALEFLKRYELTRNEHYHGTPAKLDALTFVVGSTAPGLPAFNADQIDIVRIDEPTVEEIDSGAAEGSVVRFTQASQLAYLAFNANIKPYDDPNFRKALVAASGRDRGLDLNDPSSKLNSAAQPSVSELLATSAYAGQIDGITLTFHEWLRGAFQRQFDTIATRWSEEIGVATSYVPLGPTSYNELQDAGEIEMIYGFATPDYPSPSAIVNDLARLFDSSEPGSDFASLAELIAEASATVDRIARDQRYVDIAEFIIDQALVLPLFWLTDDVIYLTRPDIKGFVEPPYGGSRFADTWIDASNN